MTVAAPLFEHAPPGTPLPAVAMRDLTVAYRDTPVLWDVDLDIPAGTLTAIIGPNGAGKSTLIKAAMGLVPVAAGSVQIFGRAYGEQRNIVGYVPQRGSVDWDFPTNALDVVMMGTYGRLGWIRRPGKAQRETALHCLCRSPDQPAQRRPAAARLSGAGTGPGS